MKLKALRASKTPILQACYLSDNQNTTTTAKVSYFFFPRKSSPVIHSFKSQNAVFFFPRSGKKKIQADFFLLREKFIGHSSGFWGNPFFFTKLVVFFFPAFLCGFCVFFSTEKFTCHSFIQFLRPEKKNTIRKKKKQLFHSFIRYSSKSAQKRTFPGKKIRCFWPKRWYIPFLRTLWKKCVVEGHKEKKVYIRCIL